MFDTTTTNEFEPPNRQRPLQRLAEITLIAMLFFVIGGEPPPHVNEPHYLCRLKHFWNPDYCANDLFLQSNDTQIVFVWTFGWLTRWLSLSATAWVGRMLVWTLLAWAWQRLSWRLIPQRFAAVLSASLFIMLTALAHLAGEWVVGGVEGKGFAYVFVLLALSELVDRRWNWVWGLIGAACAFHPIVGGWSGLVCGGIWLIDRACDVPAEPSSRFGPGVQQRFGRPLVSMLPGLVLGGVLALLGILPALALTWNQPPHAVAEAARIYVFERLPHHLALLALPREEIVLRLVRHGLLVVALLTLMRGLKVIAKPVVHGSATGRQADNARAASAASFNCIGQFAIGAVLLALAGFAIEMALWNRPFLAAKLLRYYWFRLTDVAVPIAVALYAVAIMVVGINRRHTWAVGALTAAFLLVGWHLSTTVWQRAMNPIPPADQKIRDYAAWVDACDWIAEHTPTDAVFLTPRSSQSFKWRTGRAEVATRKDIPQDARSMVEWFDRQQNIFTHDVNGVTEWVDSPSELGTERVRRLADEYGFRYVLSDRRQLLSLPIIYPTRDNPNEEYVVYRLEN